MKSAERNISLAISIDEKTVINAQILCSEYIATSTAIELTSQFIKSTMANSKVRNSAEKLMVECVNKNLKNLSKF